MSAKYCYDENGFLIGLSFGQSSAGETTIEPPVRQYPWQVPKFANGQWTMAISQNEDAMRLFKEWRESQVEELTVTVNGKTYDADEVSQGRMARAILAAEATGSTTVPFWVLANNEVASDIPLNTFKQVLAQSVIAMSNLWLPS
jgi:hypothetical protein